MEPAYASIPNASEAFSAVAFVRVQLGDEDQDDLEPYAPTYFKRSGNERAAPLPVAGIRSKAKRMAERSRLLPVEPGCKGPDLRRSAPMQSQGDRRRLVHGLPYNRAWLNPSPTQQVCER